MASAAPLRRLAAVALGLALAAGALGACGGDDGGGDVSAEKFRTDFLAASGGLRKDIANCVVDELLARLSQDDINDFYGARGSELSPANQEAQDDAVRECTTRAIATSTTAPPATEPPATTG